jgi:hypothetical protein
MALVISLNVQRRDMTASQRALVAVKAEEILPDRKGRKLGDDNKDGKNSRLYGMNRELLAKMFKVNDKYIQQAKALFIDAPDLVENSITSIPEAYATLQKRRADAKEREDRLQRLGGHREADSRLDAGALAALRPRQLTIRRISPQDDP